MEGVLFTDFFSAVTMSTLELHHSLITPHLLCEVIGMPPIGVLQYHMYYKYVNNYIHNVTG